jgi:hypothetical protein
MAGLAPLVDIVPFGVETGEPVRFSGARPALAAVRARLGLVGLLAALAAIAWWSTAESMRGMDDGPWTALGTLGWFLRSALGFPVRASAVTMIFTVAACLHWWMPKPANQVAGA